MLNFLAWGTAVLVFFSGAAVLTLYWRVLTRLAYSGLIFTTLASLGLIYLLILQRSDLMQCHRPPMTCMVLTWYFLIRNVGMMLLHAAIGVKAHQTRRPTWMNANSV